MLINTTVTLFSKPNFLLVGSRKNFTSSDGHFISFSCQFWDAFSTQRRKRIYDAADIFQKRVKEDQDDDEAFEERWANAEVSWWLAATTSRTN